MKKKIIIAFILITCTFHLLNAQQLHLKCLGASNKETVIIDSVGYIKAFKNYISLKKEILNLKSKLIRRGYIETKQLNITKQNDSLYLAYFALNNKYESLIINQTNLVEAQTLKQTGFLNEDNTLTIPINQVEVTLDFINNQLANKGDPFTSLAITNISKKNSTTLQGSLTVSKFKSRTIDKIIVKGYHKFPKSFIQRYLKIKSNTLFSINQIKEQTKTLNNLTFANQIRQPEVLFTKDSTLLYLYIEKTKSNTFDGFLGFGTNENSNNIQFDGYLNLNLTNNLNFGESLKLLYKSDENDQQTFDLKLNAPYLFKSPIGLGLHLNIFKRDSSFATVTQALKLNYQINSRQYLSANITSINSTDLLETPSAVIQDYTSTQYGVNYHYAALQHLNQLFPVNFLFDSSVGFGKRASNETTDNQYQLKINTFKIFNLNFENSIYSRLNGNYLISNTYLENELPRFGGINSIRGFEENSLIANLYLVLNTEYRYQLNTNLYVHSVIDAAYFENQITNQKENLFGFGFGFGLITKAGLFKLNYTSGKTESKPFKLSDSKIHLSLSSTF